ncbi:hypothetical protein PYW07_009047 [Mythimna separata]|uniref:Uncharacterized protein n=1 Tax=Mythimna separata TaxID=271217 RepID=A0AAD7YBR0_MYTSE|nr:hypothetical protein PYW07_009047 [Mythimna separata]
MPKPSSSSPQPKDVHCWTQASPKRRHNDRSFASPIHWIPVTRQSHTGCQIPGRKSLMRASIRKEEEDLVATGLGAVTQACGRREMGCSPSGVYLFIKVKLTASVSGKNHYWPNS